MCPIANKCRALLTKVTGAVGVTMKCHVNAQGEHWYGRVGIGGLSGDDLRADDLPTCDAAFDHLAVLARDRGLLKVVS